MKKLFKKKYINWNFCSLIWLWNEFNNRNSFKNEVIIICKVVKMLRFILWLVKLIGYWMNSKRIEMKRVIEIEEEVEKRFFLGNGSFWIVLFIL